MANRDERSDHPLTEPVIVPCLFCSGSDFELHEGEGFVRVVGWVDLAPVEGRAERRVIARLVLPDAAARRLSREMDRALRRENN